MQSDHLPILSFNANEVVSNAVSIQLLLSKRREDAAKRRYLDHQFVKRKSQPPSSLVQA